jgi:hypothetical protein
MLSDFLANEPRVLFCPSPDQPESADAELAQVGKGQAQCSYYYRHGSVTQMFENPMTPLPTNEHIQLANLGLNRDGLRVRALVIDTMFEAPGGFEQFGIVPRTHHRRKLANVLYDDGHASSSPNTNRRYTVDLADPSLLRAAFDRILKVFETADPEP